VVEKNVKILVVDDNEMIRTLFRLSFKKIPRIEVYEAQDGTEGFKRFEELNPDMVFSDIMMPGDIDGISLCKQIKGSVHKCPVILISAKGQQKDIDLGMAAGADVYKVKPLSPKDLISIAESFMN
jgi:two-component system phosphate regulon response regulator PhoB